LHDLADVELFSVKRYVHVEEEGPPDLNQKLCSFFLLADFGWYPPVLILRTPPHKNCIMKIMATVSGLTVCDDQDHYHHWSENGQKKLTTFKYHEPFYLHFNYRVDDHNNLWYAVPSVEET
jgi:hypothetical protein